MKQYVTETFVLNPPYFNFSDLDKFKNEIIYIRKNKDEYIPCLFIQDFNQCNKFLILFHGNNEDIFQLEMAAGIFREELKMNLIVVEYPGYSIYFSKKSPQIILEDTTIVYDYIKEKFNVKDEDIFIYGRSIGSAPSIFLASKRKAKALFVVSGFSSLKDVGKGLYVGWALEDIFKNIEYISQITIPTLFIHGKKDSLISWEQSKKLYENCISNQKEIKYIKNMEHNNYDLMEDVLNNINNFILKEIPDIKRINNHYNLYDVKFDNMLKTPKNILKFANNTNFSLENYTKIDKYFENINMAILLKDERIALIYDKEINICDTINFNKYFSIRNNKKIIFVNELENGNLLYCTNDGNVNIIKIELTIFSIINTFKISQMPINNCKIIELENNDMMAIINEFYPLIHISQNKNEYKLKYVTNFQNIIFNDIIYIGNNKIAMTSGQKELFIYNHLTSETNHFEIPNQLDTKNLFLINNSYLIILCEKEIYYFNLLEEKINSSILFIDSFKKYCFFEGDKIYPTIIKEFNFLFCLIGDNNGNILKISFENEIVNENKLLIIDSSKIIKFINSPVQDLLLIDFRKLLIISKNKELFIFNKFQ